MSGKQNSYQALEERLSFLGIAANQKRDLHNIMPVITDSLSSSLDTFYNKAKTVPHTAKFFANDAHIAHAKSMQVKHWSRIASGRFDEDYVKAVSAIGHTHAKLGLEPRWYIGAYALVVEGIVKALIENQLKGFLYDSKAKALTRDISVVLKAALLDMDYSITVYLDALAEEREKAEIQQQQMKAEQENALAVLNQALNKLASGDLATKIDATLALQFESLRDNYNQAVSNLSKAFSNIVVETHKISANTRELTTSTDDMARRTEQQAAALEETSTAIEQITTISRQSAQRTREAEDIVRSSAQQANKSRDIVAETVQAMGAIEDSSQKITQIISVIDEISFQTNLLALNAGVEAARAGEAGKGFAVVAQEVRELAQRSASAAKEIKTLIDKSFADVLHGVSLVNKTGEALHSIGEKVDSIQEHIGAISTAAQEQAAGIQEIHTAVASMDQLTQQNAAMVEETNAATHGLSDISSSLADLVSRFKVSAQMSFEQPVYRAA
jgi:methyl-accepting chemotaxis protein